MSDTKKQHYVPQCYLRHFASKDEKINVFDKEKMEVRTEQKILKVAMENRFYDLNFFDMYKKAELSEQEKIRKELSKILGTDNVEAALNDIDSQQYIEKKFFGEGVESIYSIMLENIIKKSSNGSQQWVIQNCYALTTSEKELFSLVVAIQVIRTKSFRDTIGATLEKFIETMAYKSQMNEEDALPKEAFKVSVDKEYVKLKHNGMILDPEMALEFAKVLAKHIWVVYVNKTNTPFYTSDDPVVNIPHKHHEFLSYEGLNSEGIEILFPISSNLLLGMYHAETYNNIFIDRKYMAVTDHKWIEYFNRAQVVHSQRFIFSISNNFDLAEKICRENPDLQIFKPRVEVL